MGIAARDIDGVAHVVPLSGGKDSTALAIALQEREPRPYTYIHTPTGDELPEVDAHLRHVQGILAAPIIRLTNGTLATQIERNHMLPNVFSRWCTRLLKLRPAGRFYEQVAPAVCYVGLRADEDERTGMRPGGSGVLASATVTQDFPFQRWGWGVDEVWACLGSHGISVPERTDCARCPFQRLGEWYNLWRQHPAVYADAEADEVRWGHTYRSPGRDTWPAGLRELRAMFEAGKAPERSLRMMDHRRDMCDACKR